MTNHDRVSLVVNIMALLIAIIWLTALLRDNTFAFMSDIFIGFFMFCIGGIAGKGSKDG